jgi:hypothetical protein
MGVLSDQLKLVNEHVAQAKEAINDKYEVFNIAAISTLKTGDIAKRIQDIPALDTSDATARRQHILEDKTAYVDGYKIEGSMSDYSGENHSQWLTIVGDKDVAGSGKGFTCNIHYDGYIDEKTKLLLPVNQFEDWGLTPDMIVEGKEWMGIRGTAKSTNTSDATATEDDIAKGKTAYAKGEKITGTLKDSTGKYVTATVDSVNPVGTNIILPERAIYDGTCQISISTKALAEKAGLTADIIKKGEVVFGIVGTYEGTTSTPGSPEIELDETDPSKAYYNYSAPSHLFHPGDKWGYWEILLGASNHPINSYSNAHFAEAYRRMYVAYKLNGQDMDGYFVEEMSGEKSYHSVYYEVDGKDYLTCYVGDLELTVDDCNYIYKCLRYDSPELMMKFTGYKYFHKNCYVTYLLFDAFDEPTRKAYMNKCQDTFQHICAVIYANYGIETSLPYQGYWNSYTSDHYTRRQKVQIAKVIHDFLVLNNTYHESSVENLDQTMYPALSKGAETPVCASYAHAFQWCCHKFGIMCHVVNGSTDSEGNARHLWNMINYENYGSPAISNTTDGSIWYECDVTWDDPTNGGTDYCQWEFFNTTTSYIQSSAGGNRRRSYRNVTSNGNEAFYDFIVNNCTATEFAYHGSQKYGGM